MVRDINPNIVINTAGQVNEVELLSTYQVHQFQGHEYRVLQLQ